MIEICFVRRVMKKFVPTAQQPIVPVAGNEELMAMSSLLKLRCNI
jgi:hypothetical protein